MRNSNGYGSISKLSGARRKPWIVRITSEISFDEETKKYTQVQKPLGYYATRQEAIKALADYNDDPYDLNIRSVTLDQIYELTEPSFTEGRRGNYKAAYKYLEPIKDTPIREIKAAQMQRCIDSCTTTQQGEIKTLLHKIYDYALRNEIIDKNPSKYLTSNTVPTQKKYEILTLEQISAISDIDSWWSKILMMLLYSGMRTKELLEIKPEWIDIDNACIDIQKAKNRPSLRKIPIHSHVIPIWEDYKDFGCNLYGYTHDGLNKAFKLQCGHTAHDCRHTFTTYMHKAKCDPLILQLLLGHRPSTITERVYTHLGIEELRESLEMLDYSI
jgi:integrase